MRAITLIVAVSAMGCPKPAPLPVFPARSCGSTLVLTLAATPTTPPSVAGEWNQFVPQPLSDRADGAWSLSLDLEPRDYAYQFEVGGKPQLDPLNPFTRWVGGVERSRLRVPDCRPPLLELENFKATPEGTLDFEVQYLEGTSALAPAGPRVTLDGLELESVYHPATRRFVVHREGLPLGKHSVRVEAEGAEPLYLPFWIETRPFDWREPILYFAFTDRFRNGDRSNDAPVPGVELPANFQGGDFAGITAALEEGYFDRLGVRALWLSPVDANPEGSFPGKQDRRYTGYHGYWPSSPRQTQRRFGSLEQLRALTSAAHRRGIRVISDLVINHLHEQHPYFTAHRADGWFHLAGGCTCGAPGCDWEQRRLDCWFTPYLPDLDWRSAAMADQLASDAAWWVENADLDGFRLDAVKHLEHTGGRTVAGTLNAIGERTGLDYYLVGETFVGVEGRAVISEYLGPHELDGQFDFPLYWPVIDSFAKGGSLKALDAAVLQGEAAYPSGAINSPFLGNHDVPRFHSIAAGQIVGEGAGQAWGPHRPPESTDDDAPYLRARFAFAFLLTQPGVPLIYYGDEVGLPGAADPDNRRPMKWGAQLNPRERSLLKFVEAVGAARAKSRALSAGSRKTLLVEDDLYAFERVDAASGDRAVVVINRGAVARTVPIAAAGRLVDAVSGSVFTGPGQLEVPPRTAAVYVR